MAALTFLDHPTADEIYSCLHNNYPTISKATVYRILNRMAEEGAIRHLRVPDGPDRFDAVTSEHHHFRCTICGKIHDIDLPELHSICSKIEDKYKFTITRYHLFFDGICPECSQKCTSH